MAEPMVACGANHTIFLKRDGTVWGCGYNGEGQLGLGDTTTRIIPTQISITNVKQVECGGSHSLFVKEDGTVWGCGNNNTGQLGLGDTTNRSIPTKIGISNVKQIACGLQHTVFLKNDGTVWVCGYNNSGQLGTGDQKSSNSIIQVNIVGIREIICGDYCTIAIKYSGVAWVCGYNGKGQLGFGDTDNRLIMTENSVLSNVKQVAHGQYHVAFLKNDGTVWGCGQNNLGQLGLGYTSDKQLTPTKIEITNVKEVICAYAHTVFLKNDGTVWVCGFNISGQFGLGDAEIRNTPTKIPIDDVEKVVCGSACIILITKNKQILGSGNTACLGLGGTSSSVIQTNFSPLTITLELFYMLLREANNYKTIVNQSLHNLAITELTANAIKANGFGACSDILSVWAMLSDQFEVLYYNENENNTGMWFTHLPASQFVISTKDIDLSAYNSIIQITLATSGSNGTAKLALSFDSGISWRTYASGWQSIDCTVEALETSGMTPAILNSIPKEQWTAANTGRLRIAFYLAKTAVTDDLAVASLSITGDTASWKKAQRSVDFNCMLPSTKTMIVQILKDGSYKMNYMNTK